MREETLDRSHQPFRLPEGKRKFEEEHFCPTFTVLKRATTIGRRKVGGKMNRA